MACSQLRDIVSRLGYKCRELCGLENRRRQLEISAPFNFKEGPAVNFPGYSDDDISLMREKAIASTAITDDDRSDHYIPRCQQSQSRPCSYSCGLGGRVAYHARRVSRGCLH